MKNQIKEVICLDERKVHSIKEIITTLDTKIASQLFKTLADENRLKIVLSLCLEDELCVRDVAHIINSTLPNTSHHLRSLHHLGIGDFRKNGKLVFYSLKETQVKELILYIFDLETKLCPPN